MQASSEPPCLCSLLSGCASPVAPVLLHSQQRHLLDKGNHLDESRKLHYLGEGILLPVPAQYQPFSIAGCRSSLSHPLLRQSVNHLHQTVSSSTYLKLHFLPPVQMQGTSSSLSTRFTQSFSALVSMLMESMQNSLHNLIIEENKVFHLKFACNSFWPPPSPSWCPCPLPARRSDRICQIGSRGQSLESSKVQFKFENLTDW